MTKSDDSNDEQIDALLRQSAQHSNLTVTIPPYSNITMLDLGDCSLSSLPTQMPAMLPSIKILFLSNNNFTQMPPIISRFSHLEMIAFKGNQMTSIHQDCFIPNTLLRWIILTNNKITAIPDTIGHCTRLQKFMLSGNRLTAIPSAIARCTELELIRLACNQIVEPPLELLQLPKLKWVALGRNTFLESVPTTTTTDLQDSRIKIFRDIDETSGAVLGRGASGITRAIEMPISSICVTAATTTAGTTTTIGNTSNEHNDDENSMTVAIKTYHNNDITSDGTPEQERYIALLVSQIQQQLTMSDDSSSIGTNLLPISDSSKTGFIHVFGQCNQTGSLVMEYLHNYRTIADPPSFSSCTRDVYNPTDADKKWSLRDTIRFVNVLLYSLQILHAHGITHGDLYGHNVLVSFGNDSDDDKYASISVRLSDFGASFLYDTNAAYGKCLETIEIRAFQVILKEVLEHCYDQNCRGDEDHILTNLIHQCDVASTFRELYIYWQQQQLKDMAKAFDAVLK